MFGSTNLYIGGEIALIGGVTVNCEIPMARKLTSSQLINSWLNFYFRMQGGYVYDLAIGGEGVGAILGMTCITGKKNHHCDFSYGLGPFWDWEDVPGWNVTGSIDVGYRYQKPEGGFIFKAYVANIGVGVGFGYTL